MPLARGEAVRETAPEVVRPQGFAPAIESAPTLLLGMQRTAGNAAVCRFLARQPAPTQTPAAAPVAKVGTVSGKRPAITETSKEFDDCNAAVAWINSGVYTGEAQPVYKPTAGKIRHKKAPDGTEQAEVDISWAYDASSTAEVIVPTWPDMTAADKAAVAKYKSALKAHEVMHFDVTDKVVKALPKTVKATGTDPQDATTNLQNEVNTYQSDAHRDRDTTFAEEVEDALRADLQSRSAAADEEPFEVLVFDGDGSRALVDIDDNRALQKLMDDEHPVEGLRRSCSMSTSCSTPTGPGKSITAWHASSSNRRSTHRHRSRFPNSC